MKVFYSFVAIACLLMATSCCTMRTTTITKTATPVTTDIIADLDIRTDKVTETFTMEFKNNEIVKVEDLESNAVYEALKKIKADLLVAPQYRIDKEICSSTTLYRVTVSGYPAFYTNFRQMPMAEKVELRELKEGASYVIVKKSFTNNDVEYDKDVVVVPVKGGAQTLNIDGAAFERFMMRERGGRPASCDRERPEMERPRESGNANAAAPSFDPQGWMKNYERNMAAVESTKKTTKYTLRQCKDMEISGAVFSTVGLASLIVVGPSLYCTISRTLGSAFMLGGAGCTCIGIPLVCVGASNKKKAHPEDFTSCVKPKQSKGMTLALQGGNGIGLALKF